MRHLTADELRRFGADGYVLLKGVVPEAWLAAADAEIDGLVAAEPPPAGTVGKHLYFPPPQRLPACDAALRESGALDVANQLVAPHRLENPIDHIQIALGIPWWTHIPGGPHIDMHGPECTDEPGSFSVLAGLYLCDESRVASGNLWVWPGSHRDHAQIFREQGVTALLKTGGHATVPGTPVPVLAERGDLLLAHFLLGHNSGGNETDRVRRIIYFRLSCEAHRDRWQETFVEPLTEFAPVAAAIRATQSDR